MTYMGGIKINVREIGWGGMVCIALHQDRHKWRSFVNTVRNVRVPCNARKFLVAAELEASEERFSSMELVS
jgi:hypothetical protein